MVLVLEDEVLEVVFQRKVLGGLVVAGRGARRAEAEVGGEVVLEVVQLDVDTQQVGVDFLRAVQTGNHTQ